MGFGTWIPEWKLHKIVWECLRTDQVCRPCRAEDWCNNFEQSHYSQHWWSRLSQRLLMKHWLSQQFPPVSAGTPCSMLVACSMVWYAANTKNPQSKSFIIFKLGKMCKQTVYTKFICAMKWQNTTLSLTNKTPIKMTFIYQDIITTSLLLCFMYRFLYGMLQVPKPAKQIIHHIE